MNKVSKHFNKVEDYFNKVDVYSKILKNNYMFHEEIFNILKSSLKDTYGRKAFSLLDIGCGNALFMSQILKDLNVESYEAWDLSMESLEEARENIDSLEFPKNFICADIAKDFLTSAVNKKFDVIWTSYALHHLSLSEKIKFFKRCKKTLNDKSYLIVVDFVNDYNSREECLKHYEENVEKKWTELSKQDKEYLYEHVCKFDFPESFSQYKKIAGDSGFAKSEKLFQQDSWAYMLFTN